MPRKKTGFGEQTVDLVHVQDVAYFAASVAEVLSKISGRSPRLSRYAIRLVRRQYHYSVDRMKEDFGFVPSTELLEGMRRCIMEYSAKVS